ncbi:MAG: NAD(P)/FAD-dependent oxidoreductase [Lentisphaeria bacterium]|nr:NAD(P)/FAD-dependent oxidoreductase [Lentisphaeria bacterium]
MIYDVAIIGGGVTGASTAWHLSHRQCKAVLLEKECDTGFGVSKANSGIVHDGIHHPTTSLKAKLEVASIKRFPELQKELHFPLLWCGIITVAFTEEELEVCRKLYAQGKANGIENVKFCTPEELYALEPKLGPGVLGGIYAPDGGTVEPYGYTFALAESARRNGVEIICDFKVSKGEYRDGLWHIYGAAGDREIVARRVVNAAGLFADEISAAFGAEKFTISPRKGEEYLLDRLSAARPEHVVFPVPTKTSKGVLVIPTAGGTTMIGPTADLVEEKDDTATTAENFSRILAKVRPMIKGIDHRDVITAFSGLRPVLLGEEDFFIRPSAEVPALIQAAGIQSPGLTASPAVGEYIVKLLGESGLELPEKTTPRVPMPERIESRKCSPEKLAELHEKNSEWTNWVCRCEKISEAEIAEAVKLGHTTMDGIKFYTRAGMGRCQGGFCSAKLMRVLSSVSGIPMEKLTKRGKQSTLLAGKLGDLQVKGFGK